MEKIKGIIKLGRNWEFVTIKNKPYLINVANSETMYLDAELKPTETLFNLIDEPQSQENLEKLVKTKHPFVKNSWVKNFIKLMKKYHILEEIEKIPDTLSQNYLTGLERQIDYLRELGKGKNNYQYQEKLKNTRIVFLGLGNIGHYLVYPLVSSGIGFFKCVDFDTVERRNIARQPIFRRNDIGKLKSDVVADYINNLKIGVSAESVNLKITSPEDVMKVIADCDLVVQCCDIPRFTVRRWITAACLKMNKPDLIVFSGRIGPFCIPGKTPCYGCLETTIARRFFWYYPLADHIAKSRIVEYPELAVVSTVTSAIASKEIVGHILGIRPETYDHFFDINPYTLKINSYKLNRQKHCYACGDQKSSKTD